MKNIFKIASDKSFMICNQNFIYSFISVLFYIRVYSDSSNVSCLTVAYKIIKRILPQVTNCLKRALVSRISFEKTI